MNYDFSRFSNQSFESFSQSLAMQELGPGVQIYGAGADGAREATFDGDFTPFATGSSYSGYVVVQAKFRKVTQSPQQDLSWLKDQLNKELAKFKNKNRKLKSPEYYILVTNIKLTPGAENKSGKGGGTLDLMLKYIASCKRDIGIKEIFIWHADVLCAMMDNYPNIRTSYSSWVLSGDVLSAALDHFKSPNFSDVINRVVRNEISDHRGIKTQDSAQSHGQPVYIDDVFVDIPLDPVFLIDEKFEMNSRFDLEFAVSDEDESIEVDDNEFFDLSELGDSSSAPDFNINIVNQLMVRLADKLDYIDASKNPPNQRYVVLGGPGQGKSTIGQFLSQLLRARLLLAKKNLPPEILRIAKATVKRAEDENIDISGPLRFPIHISLPRYADAISKNSEDAPSILRFAAATISKIADEEISPKLLRKWVEHYPSAIILDGLDEVPRTSNRSEVIREIERLFGDIAEASADTLLIVTSRPQGYINDLEKANWNHWILADLDTENAVRFAARLGEVIISDRSRRAEVISTLADAALDPSTSPLMRSPLQISLLLSLVVTRNDIPKDRWSLFERHYETLRDREIAKGGANGDLIRKFRSEIDMIHFDAGFILQVRAEKKGNASSHFSLEEFEALVVRKLKDSILDDDEIRAVAHRIMVIATTRLVFLGDREEGRIAFDVRSLQEFMAAARVMISPESKIRARLTELALKSHWANVFRIACSKVYAQAGLQELREDLLEILDKLDNGDIGTDYRAVRAGARLAVNLLSDSTAGARQTDKAKLMARASKTLEIDGVEIVEKLSEVSDLVTLNSLSLTVDENLLHEGGPVYINTLKFLIVVSRKKNHPLNSWANSKISAINHISPQILSQLLDLPYPASASSGSYDFLTSIAFAAGPDKIRAWPKNYEFDFSNISAERLFGKNTILPIKFNGSNISGLSVGFKEISCFSKVDFNIKDLKVSDGRWLALGAAVRFSKSPSIENLAAAVELIVNNTILTPIDFPWPISGCLLLAARQGIAGEEMAADIRNGKQGSLEDWKKAESHWKINGIDLINAPHLIDDIFCIATLEERGPPARTLLKRRRDKDALDLILSSSADLEIPSKTDFLNLATFVAETGEDAMKVLSWISDDFISASWTFSTCRRVSRLIHLALDDSSNIILIEKFIAKVSGGTPPTGMVMSISNGLIEMLSQSEHRQWAAEAIFTVLPVPNQSSRYKIKELDSDHLKNPVYASISIQRAFAVLRVMSGTQDPDKSDVDLALVLEPCDDQPFSAVLTKMYDGRREDDIVEKFVCKAAEIAITNGYSVRSDLVGMISNLIESRESNLDDENTLLDLGLPQDIDLDSVKAK